MKRFRDSGETVWSFLDDILVRCPSCSSPAHVTPLGTARRGLAKLTCTSCGLARKTPEAAPEPRRCQHCNRWIPRADWKTVVATPRTRHDQVVCPRCHRVARSTVRWVLVGAPEDPFFGLPLFLQAPCCDDILWAFNARHLELLDALVRASVREREREARARGDVVSNATLLARLPRWMKSAKNRDSVIACIEKLRRRGMTSRAGRGR
jgi:hypothetical protein